MRQTGMKNGVLSYHLRNLEKDGKVRIERTAGKTSAFPLQFATDDSKLIKLLRRTTSRDIILALLHESELTLEEIVSKIRKTQSTTYLYLSQLIDDEVVTPSFSNKNKVYRLKDPQKIGGIIDMYFPSSLQNAISQFEDSFNSL
jgi:predicted transcriptional regulator